MLLLASRAGALCLSLSLSLSLLDACRAAPNPVSVQSGPTRRALQGRFLHITDFHPDPFYKTYSSTQEDAACHRKHGPAGFYGAETSACDSPLSLVNDTFRWINDHLRDDIDFIIWTGDSARHDNDEKLPRTQEQVIQQNELLVNKFADVFGNPKTDPYNDFIIPIVPTFGNNDIMPHNIFLAGPNKWTMRYLDLWKGFIPEEQRHQFQQGGWFFVEVIPGQLAVFSLNTMYFFDSNSGVDGCANKHEPGYEHMEWLRIQLQILRDRGMKAILIGHVPPARTDSKASWDETCWQKYTLLQRQYRDLIVGSLFGHMNIDHFMLQDFKDLKKGTKKGRMGSLDVTGKEVQASLLEDGEVTVASATDYLQDLGDAWAKLPAPPDQSEEKTWSMHGEDEEEDDEADISVWQWIWSSVPKPKKGKGDKVKKPKKPTKKQYLKEIGGPYAERYSMSHVSPSVVPNYFPTLRVFTYNISGLENALVSGGRQASNHRTTRFPDSQTPLSNPEGADLDQAAYESELASLLAGKKGKESRKKSKKWSFKVPLPPSKSAPPGPAYSPQTFTLLGYTQYFANLTLINNDFVPDPNSHSHSQSSPDHIEGVTPQNHTIFGLAYDPATHAITPAKWKEGKHGKHQGKQPRPEPHPRKFVYEVEYETNGTSKFALQDLTVRSYVELARRIGGDKQGKAGVVEYESDDDGSSSLTKNKDGDGKKKKEKGKKGKKHHHPSHVGAWFTFVQRAFVGTMDESEIEDLFGASVSASADVETAGEL